MTIQNCDNLLTYQNSIDVSHQMKNLEKQAFLRITKQSSEPCEIYFNMLLQERIYHHFQKQDIEGEIFLKSKKLSGKVTK